MNNIWKSDQGDNTYINPILYTDYSDPDVVRVGDRYFLTASSFNCLPGLPILASYDLVNWELVNYAVKELPFEVYDKPAHAKGVWAPSMRYHDGKFWIYFGMPDEGIFMTTATDPLGEWEPLVCVKACKGWIDPCPLWDEDGNAYLVHAFAKSRVGFNGVLDIVKMSPDGKSFLDEGVRVIDVDPDHRTIEGPKFYKRDGYYYIFAPAGGVPQGWQLAMRSKNIYGPYEKKIVLHQGNSEVNGPHQGALVDTPFGEEWFIHFQDAGVYGRITHMQPVTWEDGWPVMGIDSNGDGIGEPVMRHQKPKTNHVVEPTHPTATDLFEEDTLGLQWQWYANYKDSFYSLKERPGYLRLYNLHQEGEEKQILWHTPNLLNQKLCAPSVVVDTYGDFGAISGSDKSGLAIVGKDYAYVAMMKDGEGYKLKYIIGVPCEENPSSKKEEVIQEVSLTASAVYLRLEIEQGGICTFSYSLDGVAYTSFNTTYTADACTWVGAKVGLFAINELGDHAEGFTDFEYFKVNNK